MIEIEPVVEKGLGHSSYVMGLGDDTALVVDPARFPDRQRRVAAERGWHITWTADTHSHADYISGSPELAADGATFLASAGGRSRVSRTDRSTPASQSTSRRASSCERSPFPGTPRTTSPTSSSTVARQWGCSRVGR